MERLKKLIQEIKNTPLLYLSIACFGGLFIVGDLVKDTSLSLLIVLLMIIIGITSLFIQFKAISKAEKRNSRKKSKYWTIRWDNTEYDIKHPNEFHINFDDALTDLEMGEIPFIVLSPPNQINGITFLQVAKNKNLMHVEAGMLDKQKNNNIRIVFKDGLNTGEVLDMFILFFNKGELDISGWKELK